MKDLPAFTTENGVASLVLQEIPYTQIAYVIIRDTPEPTAFVEECADFCRAVGAEYIYATGHEALEDFPFHTAIWKMEKEFSGLPGGNAVCTPVTKETLEQWRSIYNEKMKSVPNSAFMSREKEQMILSSGAFIYRDSVLLGIGMASNGQIDAVVSIVPGGGEEIVLALCNRLGTRQVSLEVASENKKAVALYERLGFQKTEEKSMWYRIK